MSAALDRGALTCHQAHLEGQQVSEVIDFIFVEQRDLIALFGFIYSPFQVSIQLPIQLDGITVKFPESFCIFLRFPGFLLPFEDILGTLDVTLDREYFSLGPAP